MVEDKSSQESPLIRIRGLRFRRGGQIIFDGVDLDIPRGQVSAIMGPSGSGKTTLLKLVAGQLQPDAGSIEVDGLNVHQLSRRELFRLRTRMGMLFQSGALLTDLSVFENVAYPVREHADLPESMIRRLVLMKLEAVGLRGARELMPAELSGGMARRVALARAIVLDPMMVMYDEPFTGQDPISMGVLAQLIRRLNDAVGLSSILVSHDVGGDRRHRRSALSNLPWPAGGARGRRSSWPTPTLPGCTSSCAASPDGPVRFHYPAAPLADDLLMGGGGA